MMNVQDRIAKLNFLGDIRNLQSRLQAIEKWRADQADPKMTSNKNFIKSIDVEIKNRIKPAINKAVKDIEKATEGVQQTLDEANAVFDQVKKTGDDLKRDGIVIKEQVDDLRSVLDSEITKIVSAFRIFGIELKVAADDIVVKTENIGEEMREARREIQPTLDSAITWAKRISSRSKRHDWLGAFSAASACVKRVLFEGVSSSSGPLVPEVLEALREISTAFKKLGVSFGDFGTVIKSAPEDLGGTINGTSDAMKIAISNFTGGFGTLIDNLSNNLKGLPAAAGFTPEPIILAPMPKTRPHPSTGRAPAGRTLKQQQQAEQRIMRGVSR